jgi:hypothetical protein
VLYHDSYKIHQFICFLLRSATLEAPVFCGVSTEQTSSTHGPNDKMLVEEGRVLWNCNVVMTDRLMIIIGMLFTNKYVRNNNK